MTDSPPPYQTVTPSSLPADSGARSQPSRRDVESHRPLPNLVMVETLKLQGGKYTAANVYQFTPAAQSNSARRFFHYYDDHPGARAEQGPEGRTSN